MDNDENNKNQNNSEDDDKELISDSSISLDIIDTGKKKRVANVITLTIACLILGIIIALQYKSMKDSEAYNSSTLSTISDYQAQIINLSNEIDLLTSENKELIEKLNVIEGGTNEEQIIQLQEELNSLKKFAGLSKVSGSGMKVTVNFKDEATISSASNMLQMLINEIKAANAQALSINGERIVAMSEVRVINSYLVINGKTFTQPFEILVIGNQRSLTSALNMAGGVVNVLRNKYGAEVEILEEDKVIINAFSGSTEMTNVILSSMNSNN